MSLIDLKLAASQSEAWKTQVLAKVVSANIKVMRMDGRLYPDESHDHPEGLLVIDDQLNLTIGNEAITVHAGELFVVPVGGSRTLLRQVAPAHLSFSTHEA